MDINKTHITLAAVFVRLLSCGIKSWKTFLRNLCFLSQLVNLKRQSNASHNIFFILWLQLEKYLEKQRFIHEQNYTLRIFTKKTLLT